MRAPEVPSTRSSAAEVERAEREEASRTTERPASRRDEVELYVRTYSTILRTSGEVRLRAFEPAHRNVDPSLHPGAASTAIDAGALIYAVNRLPAVASAVDRVVLGQLPEHFARALGARIDEWQPVQAPARRRQWHYDGAHTLAVHVASASDIDDVIPTLVAYQIEWNKVHARFKAERTVRGLVVEHDQAPDDGSDWLELVRTTLGIAPDDWQRLRRGWGAEFRARDKGGRHVLLISVDGLHASDLTRWVMERARLAAGRSVANWHRVRAHVEFRTVRLLPRPAGHAHRRDTENDRCLLRRHLHARYVGSRDWLQGPGRHRDAVRREPGPNRREREYPAVHQHRSEPATPGDAESHLRTRFPAPVPAHQHHLQHRSGGWTVHRVV